MEAVQRWRRRRKFHVVDGDDGPRGGGNGGLSTEDRRRIDEILEKISKEGLQSLTSEEQEILRRASRRE